ncbi:MAG: hydrogenase expression/formation protein HypE [Pirellulales bacterium]
MKEMIRTESSGRNPSQSDADKVDEHARWTPEETTHVDLTQWQCPLPLRDYPQVVLSHGGGGKLTSELIESMFLPAFGVRQDRELRDSAVLGMQKGNYAFSTDSYVIQPLFFPGGSIGQLAIHGTVNDLAMSGARPLFLSVAFILEEGFAMESLQRIVQDMGRAAAEAAVQIVTGDTKVVERGHGDGIYINTTGLGWIQPNVSMGIDRVRAGDVILINGTIGDHGMAIMSVRENLEFEAPIVSDTAALHQLVAEILAEYPEVHMMRDPTRGGVAASLNEIASACRLGIELDESQLPIQPVVQSACEILGLDPLLVANEGKFLIFVPEEAAERVMGIMRAHPLGRDAQKIGRVVESHAGLVVVKTRYGANRVLPQPIGEQLPRIC